MTPSRAFAPLAAGFLGLAGSLGATFFLYHAAARSLDRVLEERLRGAGETAAELLASIPPSAGALRGVMVASGLEGAYLLDPSLRVLADATGPAGSAVDLLRVDETRVRRAFAGEESVAFGWALGELHVATAYFPVRDPSSVVRSVLALEAGRSFASGRWGLRRALWGGVGLSLLGALALGVVALRWSRGEEQRRHAAERAARGEALVRMAAMAAHEVRNPLGVIRGAVELVRERAGAGLAARDREALGDILGEVERLRRLTEDLLDVGREPELVVASFDLAKVAAGAARALEQSHPGVAVHAGLPPMAVDGDRGRLHQVLANLLLNAAQAGARRIELSGHAADGFARVVVHDDGPGVDPAMRGRLFEPFATGRAGGKGLGLAFARRCVERHGGCLALLDDGRAGATFELRLPLGPGQGGS